MAPIVCEHVERLKQLGVIRDYEKILLNLCHSCPSHLKRTRDKLGIKISRRVRCVAEKCKNDVVDWKMFVCLHCIYCACESHAEDHFKGTDPGHAVGCTISDGTVFCFACDDYVFDGALEGMRETVQHGRCAGGGNVTPFTEIMAVIKPTVLCLDSKSTIGLRGLVNLKNTCYMNCIIQVLAHTPLLADFFLSECLDLDCNEIHDGKPCLMACMYDIFRQFYDGGKSPLMLTNLLGKMWKSAPHLASTDQQDAHEFLTAILEGMGRHFTTTQRPCAIEGMFYGTLKSTVRCLQCRSQSITKEPFMEISLEIFGDAGITLEECLLRYTKVEDLSHTIDCGSCGQKRASSKQLELLKVPLILCMHFKRFQNLNHNKWEHHIRFDTHINLILYSSSRHEEIGGSDQTVHRDDVDSEKVGKSPSKKTMRRDFVSEIRARSIFRIPSLTLNDDFEYSLFAVVSHLGSSEGGHYITYIRNAHKTWFLCDDHVITRASLEDVLSCQAYMLFYHRTQLPQRPTSS